MRTASSTSAIWWAIEIERRPRQRRARHAEGDAADDADGRRRPTTARPVRRRPAPDRRRASRPPSRRDARAPGYRRRAVPPPRSGSTRPSGCCPRRPASAPASARRASGTRQARASSPSQIAARSSRPITEEPVPCVALTGPGSNAPWAKRAEWESAMTAPTGTPSGSGARPAPAGNGPVDETMLGIAARGMSKIDSSSSSQRAFDHVEQLRARSVAGLDDRLAAEARQDEGVDRADAELARSRRAPVPTGDDRAAIGPWRRRTSGSSGRPLLRRMTAPWPASRSDRQTLSVRWSCHDRTGVRASPLRRSQMTQDSRWVLRPTETTRFAVAGSSASPTARRTLAQISFAVLLDPAGLRRRQRDGRLPAADHLSAIVDHEALGRAGALIDRQDERVRHLDSPFNSNAAATMPSRLRPKWSRRNVGLMTL